MDLIPYCAILFSNILTVAEAHRKHVPQTNPNCTVLLFLPWFNNGDMFGKKKKKEREREREREKERGAEETGKIQTDRFFFRVYWSHMYNC